MDSDGNNNKDEFDAIRKITMEVWMVTTVTSQEDPSTQKMYLNEEGVILRSRLIGQEIKSKINHVCSKSKRRMPQQALFASRPADCVVVYTTPLLLLLLLSFSIIIHIHNQNLSLIF